MPNCFYLVVLRDRRTLHGWCMMCLVSGGSKGLGYEGIAGVLFLLISRIQSY